MMNREARRSRCKKNGSRAIGDHHLQSHLHLTNCIHMRNHMHRHSPVLADKALMRDLAVLRRSASLRDPLMSSPSWVSPSVLGMSSRKLVRDDSVHSARRSLAADGRGIQLSMSSPLADAGILSSKVANAEGGSDGEVGIGRGGDKLSKGKVRHSMLQGSNPSGRSENLYVNFASKKTEERYNKFAQKGEPSQDAHVKILSEQLDEVSDEAEFQGENPYYVGHHKKHLRENKISDEAAKEYNYGHCIGSNGVKRCRRRRRRKQASNVKITDGTRKDQSSNSMLEVMHPKHYRQEGRPGDDGELEMTQASRNGCGIPWNWSRIHHRGRTFLDLAGKSLSCGLSDSRTRKMNSPIPQSTERPNFPSDCNHTISSTNSDSESTPLLNEPFGSRPSIDSPLLAQEYSWVLGPYHNHGLRHEQDSDLMFEERSGRQYKSNGSHNVTHRCLTQKYVPRTFRDLVGQNLIGQALSNAVMRRKVGLVYVFYGPHGTGKSSCAHIFAKALNCLSSEHPKPCDSCSSCISHNLDTNKDVMEIGPNGSFALKGISDVLNGFMLLPLSSRYKVLIIDDCDTLRPELWVAIIKAIDRKPRHVVFIFISTHLDLPRVITSRCQKFFFPKLRESEIAVTLQWIATSEGIEIEKEALKLVASRSDGNLRDAEMTLDQLCLLGQRISVNLVQELVGLVSDEKLVDLLDLALSADTVNTVKSLRDIMEAGVDPLDLMSQLGTIITDILAGSYLFTQERPRRKFFDRRTLSRGATERLRLALKMLSKAEKQLRSSSDKVTWLTAALLQLAPDHQYKVPDSSPGANFNHSPAAFQNLGERDAFKSAANDHELVPCNAGGLSGGVGQDIHVAYGNGGVGHNSADKPFASTRRQTLASLRDNEDIWEAFLKELEPGSLKQLLSKEGKLISVSSGAAATVQLALGSHVSKSKAEAFRELILRAFESVLRSAVILELTCSNDKDSMSLSLSSRDCYTRTKKRWQSVTDPNLKEEYMRRLSKGKFVQEDFPAQAGWGQMDQAKIQHDRSGHESLSSLGHKFVDTNGIAMHRKGLGSPSLGDGSPSQCRNGTALPPEVKGEGGQVRNQSLLKGRVSLAHVIQKAEACTRRSGWSRHKAVSISEKLEQENMRLEPRSKSLLCWETCRNHHGKFRRRIARKAAKTRSLLKLVTCGRCR